MKKVAIVFAAALLVAALVPAAASAGKAKKQTVEGAIASAAPYTDDTGCYAGLHRRLSIATSGAANGIIGYEFDVDKTTWNKPFVLEATGGQGAVDLDIYFYAEFGTVDDVAGDPVNAGSPYTVSFNTRDTVGESGKVPPDMNKVIVCMMAGGVEGTFTYTAGKGVKLPKS